MDNNTTTNTKKSSSSKIFYIILSILIVGFFATMYFTIMNVYVPVNQEVITHENKDVFVVVNKENYILIPLLNFFKPKETMVHVDIYFKNDNLTKASFLSEPFLSSNTSSLLSLTDSKFNGSKNYTSYDLTMKLGHPLYIGNYSQKYELIILYRPNLISNDTTTDLSYAMSNATRINGDDTFISKDTPASVLGKIEVLRIPLEYEINSLDFSRPEYFWIIALGVVTSRIFSITGGGTLGSASIKFDVGELIWIPFSAIITLLIFSSFIDQVDLTNDVILNLALAFGFGFGFDKILEAWKKAPTSASNT